MASTASRKECETRRFSTSSSSSFPSPLLLFLATCAALTPAVAPAGAPTGGFSPGSAAAREFAAGALPEDAHRAAYPSAAGSFGTATVGPAAGDEGEGGAGPMPAAGAGKYALLFDGVDDYAVVRDAKHLPTSRITVAVGQCTSGICNPPRLWKAPGLATPPLNLRRDLLVSSPLASNKRVNVYRYVAGWIRVAKHKSFNRIASHEWVHWGWNLYTDASGVARFGIGGAPLTR
jgi:hypothetical protein